VPYKDKKKQREYQLKWSKNIRLKAIEKLGGKCVKCSTTESLEFDHVDPKSKLFTIGEKIGYNKKLFEKELIKCQLLCYYCHKEKNKIDNGEAKHGSLGMYVRHKCRCDECKNNYRNHMKLYRREKRKIFIPQSSNGRTEAFEASYGGSNPS
jgi:hypothetical protein